MEIKVKLRYLIVFVFSFVFLKSIFLSEQGFGKYFAIKQEIVRQENKIAKLNNKIDNLNQKIAAWLKDDFEIEKMAREDLQFGYANEKVYLLKKS